MRNIFSSNIISFSYHQSSLQLLGPLVVGRVQVDAVEPGVHAGVAETLDAQHRLLGGAEHREGLIVELALNRGNIKIQSSIITQIYVLVPCRK